MTQDRTHLEQSYFSKLGYEITTRQVAEKSLSESTVNEILLPLRQFQNPQLEEVSSRLLAILESTRDENEIRKKAREVFDSMQIDH